jgi:hypothetical protein
MNLEPHDQASPAPHRWPWFLLAGVILFVLVSTLWMLVFVQRVKRIRDATYPPTNAPAAATNRAAASPASRK